MYPRQGWLKVKPSTQKTITAWLSYPISTVHSIKTTSSALPVGLLRSVGVLTRAIEQRRRNQYATQYNHTPKAMQTRLLPSHPLTDREAGGSYRTSVWTQGETTNWLSLNNLPWNMHSTWPNWWAAAKLNKSPHCAMNNEVVSGWAPEACGWRRNSNTVVCLV